MYQISDTVETAIALTASPASRSTDAEKESHNKAADERNTPRTYRLSNILTFKVNATSFQRPKRFDLANFWQAATSTFKADIYTATASLRLTARGAKLLKQVSAAIHQAIVNSTKGRTPKC